MANYVKITDFAAKDSLPTGNPNKVASGTQVDGEFEAIETAIATKEDTANKGIANGYASLNSSGDVPDGQLSSNVPLKDTLNIFSEALSVTNIAPVLHLGETDAGADAKNWIIRASGGFLHISVCNDALPTTAQANAISISRSGTTATNVNITATTAQINSNTIWHAGNDGSGSGLDADTVDGSHASAFATASHAHSAADLTSGELPDARVVLSNVSQWQAALETRNISGRNGRTKTLSTSAPTGGADGDIWYRYS